MEYFDGVKKNFGFGCMRLPMKGEKVDYEEFSRMIDYYLAEEFNYFDTAHVYIGGQNETALRDCLVKRYPRENSCLRTNFPRIASTAKRKYARCSRNS